MTSAVGIATLKLKRYRIKDWKLDGMNPKEIIELENR